MCMADKVSDLSKFAICRGRHSNQITANVKERNNIHILVEFIVLEVKKLGEQPLNLGLRRVTFQLRSEEK